VSTSHMTNSYINGNNQKWEQVYPEEKEFILFFSKRLGDDSIPSVLEKSDPITLYEAQKLGDFFWRMIDDAVSLQDAEDCPWPEGYEFWSEKVLQSMAAFLKNSGYEKVLSDASKNQKA
jgi:hypothetical protein